MYDFGFIYIISLNSSLMKSALFVENTYFKIKIMCTNLFLLFRPRSIQIMNESQTMIIAVSVVVCVIEPFLLHTPHIFVFVFSV